MQHDIKTYIYFKTDSAHLLCKSEVQDINSEVQAMKTDKLNTSAVTRELETTHQRLNSVERNQLGAWYKVPMSDAIGMSSFPQTVPYSSVLGPKTLPFRVHGEFKTNGPIGSGVVGIVYHVGNDEHDVMTGFKIVLSNDQGNSYRLLFYVPHFNSYYSTAESVQTGLDDGNWHSFEAIASAATIQLIVDGIDGPLKSPSDEREIQTVKEFGRIETTANYVIGQDPCCTGSGESRTLSGQIRNLALSWHLQSEVQEMKSDVQEMQSVVQELKTRPATTQVVSGGRNSNKFCIFTF